LEIFSHTVALERCRAWRYGLSPEGQSPENIMEDKLAGNQDMRSANETYTGFLSLFKWGTIISAAVALLVILIIA
jgi:hypothetical protein